MLGPADLEAWTDDVETDGPTAEPAANRESARERRMRLMLRLATGTRLSLGELYELGPGRRRH
ncbi:MAG: hypothetical protein ABTQ29_12965 [Siculibacillus sp.]